MKLKVKKSFQPCEIEGNDELFQNGIFVFNITKLSSFLQSNERDFPIEKLALATLGLTSNHLDESTVLKANLDKPIIVAEIAPGGFNLIDGNHRVERARREGVSALPAYRVGPELHYRFLSSVEGYVSYVKYWNSKVAVRAKTQSLVRQSN